VRCATALCAARASRGADLLADDAVTLMYDDEGVGRTTEECILRCEGRAEREDALDVDVVWGRCG